MYYIYIHIRCTSLFFPSLDFKAQPCLAFFGALLLDMLSERMGTSVGRLVLEVGPNAGRSMISLGIYPSGKVDSYAWQPNKMGPKVTSSICPYPTSTTLSCTCRQVFWGEPTLPKWGNPPEKTPGPTCAAKFRSQTSNLLDLRMLYSYIGGWKKTSEHIYQMVVS